MANSDPHESYDLELQSAPTWRRVLPIAVALSSVIGFNACTDEHTDTPATSTTIMADSLAPTSTLPTVNTVEATALPTLSETTTTLSPELAWFEQQAANPGVVRISDVPLAPPAEIVLEGQGISDFVLGEKKPEDLKVLEPEFMLAIEHQSGLLVNIYKGDQMRSDLGVSNGMPDISMGSPEAVSIMINYVMEHLRSFNTAGYVNEQELAIIESLNETHGLANNVLNIVLVKQGRLCPEDMYPRPVSADDACTFGGGLEMIREPKPNTSAIMVLYVPENYDPRSKEAYITAATAHEIGHYMLVVSGAQWRHILEANVKASDEMAVMGDIPEENKQAVFDALVGKYY